jgi:hypothetical protein
MSKDLSMDIDWRLVQVFVGFEGVSEVSVASHDTRKVSCTCPTFATSAKCSHSKFVRVRMAENEGNYVVQIPEDVPDEDAIEAMLSTDTWREFVKKHAKVEAID